MKKILSQNNWQKKINSRFIKSIAGVIVEGPVNYEIFKQIIPKEKIYIIPNFAEDYLFVTDEEINKKFESVDTIEILYLSNLISGKGYDELVDAYISLSLDEQKKIKIKFVGGFEDYESEKSFLKKINALSNIKYLGKFIDGEEKRELYCNTHVFCLPTYYPFEGQPISILEGYATGCVVISSNHSGIPFIFKNEENGFMVEKKSVSSLTDALKKVILNKKHLKEIAFHNRNEALKKYRTEIYQQSILSIFSSEK
jgi:glycosyltransferase involved in cell wall biosynthesis